MFIAVQFPLADSRALLSTETNRLKYPTWPLPEPDREFIRRSGIVRRRQRGGLASWSGEEIYCSAKRALRFQPLLRYQPLGALGNSVSLNCVFRRFLFNGEVVSRVELGFQVVAGENSESPFPLSRQECLDLIEGCLSIKVNMQSVGGVPITCDLLNCSQHLAKHYLQSTTRLIGGELAQTEDWWISPGSPLLLIEYKDGEISRLPKYARLVEVREGFSGSPTLHYCRVERTGIRLGVWFVGNFLKDLDLARRLRLHIFRFHAERECLKRVLRLMIQDKLQPGVRTDCSNNLQQYLLGCNKLFSKKPRFGLSHSKILEEIQRFEDIINPGERATLLTQLSSIDVRKNIYHNVEQFTRGVTDSKQNIYVYGSGNRINVGIHQRTGGTEVTKYEIKIGDNVKFMGDFIVANTIQDSFNKISSSAASDEIKEKLKQLTEAVTDMCNHLSQEKAREAARDLETLTSEALSDKPRRKWYKLSAQGLIDAAKTVGQVAAPVISIIGSLLPLLV